MGDGRYRVGSWRDESDIAQSHLANQCTDASVFQTLTLGALSFMIGGTISATKAGLTRGTHGSLKREWQAVCAEWWQTTPPPHSPTA